MSRPVAAIVALLLCSPLMADDAQARHDPIARWLNDHSHEVMGGTLGLMALVGDHQTVDYASATLDGMIVSLAAAEGLKLVIDQPRPREASAIDGFPSSHATSAFAFAHGISDWRSDWGPYFYAFAAGVGWARVEEGFHTTEQVVAGAVLGIWLAGAALDNNGYLLHRGDDTTSLQALSAGVEKPLRFEGGTSVVLWRRVW